MGQLNEIQLVLIVAEPGDPHAREVYPGESAAELLEEVSEYSYRCFETGQDQFHRNIRLILNLCWPNMPFADQMRKTWITESSLCSATKEVGPVNASVARFCTGTYLSEQLSLMPHAMVVALGTKAQQRILRLDREFVAASSAAPPGGNFAGARASWERVASEIQSRASSRTNTLPG